MINSRVFYCAILMAISIFIGSNTKAGQQPNETPVVQRQDSASPPPVGMVLVPAGTYTMGSSVVGGSSMPEHTINVPAFYIDIYEVTNAQYKAFCDATGRDHPDPGKGGPWFYIDYNTDLRWANYPVMNVSWNDAKAYCNWRGVGFRLPTEAEWELAAKGDKDNREWPWGNTWIVGNANVWYYPDIRSPGPQPDGYEATSPVGAYPNGVSPAGCYDMAGNVSEWCEDDWHKDYMGAPTDGSAWIDSPRDSIRVLRGGSWGLFKASPRCALRQKDSATSRDPNNGFRCAKTP